jgi:phosphatidylserine/phosphatidylglycerophosphate/cardiolipin synthase-like enzyme
MHTCAPADWFLDANNQAVPVALRGTGPGATVDAGELLYGRFQEWTAQNTPCPPQGTQDPPWFCVPNPIPELTMPYTSHNEVLALVDGKSFMSHMETEINNVAANDFVLITGWEFWQYRSLIKRVDENVQQNDPTFLPNVLSRAYNRNASLRVLAFGKGPPGCKDRTENFVKEVNQFAPDSACLAAPPNFAMSHHQKEVFIGRVSFDNSRAYVGGIDLGKNRWDDPDHDEPAIEHGPRGTRRNEGNYGWHDIQVMVRGDALVQLWANFAERWDYERKKKATKQITLPPCPLPPWDWTQWNHRPQNLSNKHVQVLRTIGPASTRESGVIKPRLRGRRPGAGVVRFMPDGERTVLCGLKKAIANAECYIYIEEQFLWDCELADFIAAKMQAPNSAVRLIIVMTAGCELPGAFGQYGFFLRDAFFRTILAPGNVAYGNIPRIYPYGLFQTTQHGPLTKHKRQEIYVHSKLVIIDDRYVAIGSANVDARSMHIETELTLGIVDGDTVNSTLGNNPQPVCRFARDLRKKLWREHAGQIQALPNADDDPITALQTWFPGAAVGTAWPATLAAAKQQQVHHLRCYINDPGRELLTPCLRRLIDRNDRIFY